MTRFIFKKLNSPVLRLKDCETKSNNSVKESEEFLRLKEAYESKKFNKSLSGFCV